MIKSCLRVLLEAVPEEIDCDELEENLKKVNGVKDVLDFHVWSLTHGKVCLAAIIECEGNNHEGVLRNATLECRKVDIYHTIIQVMNRNELDSGHKSYSDVKQNIH